MAVDDIVETLPEPPVTRKECPPLRCQPCSAPRARARAAFEELEPGRPFQFLEVAPCVAIRHPHSSDGFLDGSKLVDLRKESGSAVAEFDAFVEDDPDLEPRLHQCDFIIGRLRCAAANASAVRWRPSGSD